MVVTAATLWGTLSILVKVAYRLGAEPLSTLGARYLVAAAIVWIALGAGSRGALRVGRRNVLRIAVLGLVGYGIASAAFFIALDRIDASLAAIILYTYPTMVAAVSVRLFGEPLTRRTTSALALTFAGVALAVLAPRAQAPPDLGGVLVCLIAPVGYAVFSVLSFRWRLEFKPEAIVAWGLPLAAVPIAVLGGPARVARDIAGWPLAVWVVIGAMALFPTIGAIGLYVRGMSRLGPPGAAIAATVEPVVTVLLAVVFLGERLGPSQWVGAALVVAGVAVAEGIPAVRLRRAP